MNDLFASSAVISESWLAEQIEGRINEYVNALPGTLLDSDASQNDLATAREVYCDGLKDGLEWWHKPIQALLDQGFRVEIINLAGCTFNEKYSIYKESPQLGKRYAYVDEHGKIFAQQG